MHVCAKQAMIIKKVKGSNDRRFKLDPLSCTDV